VWIKHLTLARHHGLARIPHTIAELGPGDSLGVGLAALLSGVDRYYSFDVVRYSEAERNLQIFEELVELFRRRAGTPDRGGWPPVQPYVEASWFPGRILTDEILAAALDPGRLEAIRRAMRASGRADGPITIRYVVPWTAANAIDGSVDMIYSHSV